MNEGARIDWEEVKQRVNEGQARLDGILHTRQEEISAIYEDRANTLAQRGVQEQSTEDTIRILVFSVGGKHCGIELRHLSGIVKLKRWTRVPGSSAALLGVMNMRGEVRSVLDLGRVLDMPPSSEDPSGCVLMLVHGEHRVGVRVDAVEHFEDVLHGDLRKPSSITEENLSRFLLGLTPTGIMLIDARGIVNEHLSRRGRSDRTQES